VATVNFALHSGCAGGGHITLNVSLNGGAAKQLHYTTDALREPLSALTDEERELAAMVILKLHFAGQSRQTMRDQLTAPGGVTVTI
jgi:hypothetical protein